MLAHALSSAAGDCRVLVLQAKGRFFCAGADISIMKSGGDPSDRIDRLTQFAKQFQDLGALLEAFPAPTIAAINGICTGGGLELALACDFRIASNGATFGLPETKLGLLPAAGGTQRIARIAGRANALDLVLTGRLVNAAEAVKMGFVNESVTGTAEERALDLAETLALQPWMAMQEAKRCIALAGSPAGFLAEIEGTRKLHQESETVERITAFLSRSTKPKT